MKQNLIQEGTKDTVVNGKCYRQPTREPILAHSERAEAKSHALRLQRSSHWDRYSLCCPYFRRCDSLISVYTDIYRQRTLFEGAVVRSSNSMGETIDLSQEHDEEAHARGAAQ